MSTIHTRAARSQSRTMQTIDRLDLELEKQGASLEETPESREEIAAFAESRGYDRVARRLRELNARRYGYDQPTLEAVANDGRRPLKSHKNRPLLRAVEDDVAGDFDPDLFWWSDVRRICDRHDPEHLSLPGRLIQEALRRAHLRHGA